MMKEHFDTIQSYLLLHASDYVVILFWALVLSSISMLIYKMTSPQKKLKILKTKQNEIQEMMKDDELMEDQALPMVKNLLKVSSTRLVLTFLPALLSGIPILLMWGYLSYSFERTSPQTGDIISLNVSPAAKGIYINEQFLSSDEKGDIALVWPSEKIISMKDHDKHEIFDINGTKPEYFINKWQWWNVIIPSPYGYIKTNSDIDSVVINLPFKEYIQFGPWWFRSWFLIFIIGMITFSLCIKLIFKIE